MLGENVCPPSVDLKTCVFAVMRTNLASSPFVPLAPSEIFAIVISSYLLPTLHLMVTVFTELLLKMVLLS